MKLMSRRTAVFVVALIVAIAAGAKAYSEWRVSRDFPFLRSSYRARNGPIRVLRSEEESLHIRMDHSEDVVVSFHTEQKDLGSVRFRPPYFAKSVFLHRESLGEASFVTIRVQGGRQVDLEDLRIFSNRRNPKFLILALDGATWRLLTPLIRAGVCPNFKALMEQGSYGKLSLRGANLFTGHLDDNRNRKRARTARSHILCCSESTDHQRNCANQEILEYFFRVLQPDFSDCRLVSDLAR